ncbi:MULTISPECIES: hypothetical protein [Leptospira]|uniref:Uncharacterized protein n=1 Tax=Leptospira limi TaxID=2950023 RepID=A0ABT3M216_9LEPT|nr:MULTISPECIES: hypothetical protein [Leptospira]MCW7464022.1 hypothetical protein [Leptospira limi]TGK92483.1 hypothetical protein EHQ34_17855 [Leptospira levettii]
MEVRLFGKKNQTNLRIDSKLQVIFEEKIKKDFFENKSVISELTISSVGVDRLLSKLNLRYSQGVGVRKYEDIEFVLLNFISKNLRFLAFYDTKLNTTENKFKVDFLTNTAGIFEETIFKIKTPILIIKNHSAIFFNYKNHHASKIFIRFEEEEYNRHFELIKSYFDFLVLPRKYFTNEGILELTSKLQMLFQAFNLYAFNELDFLNYLKLKKYKYLKGMKGIFIQPRNNLELILLNYLESVERDFKYLKN